MSEYASNHELIQAWDRNECIHSIEMGGIGPGYEQAIQTGIFETIREFNHSDRLTQKLKEASESRDDDQYNATLDEALRAAMDKYGRCLNGLSGAQAGAIKSAAGLIVVYGYNEAMDRARGQGIERDRFIITRKEFPR